MKKFKVIKFFQWGQLKLDKGQIIRVEQIDGQTVVYPEHYPDNWQRVTPQAVDSMIWLKKIEPY